MPCLCGHMCRPCAGDLWLTHTKQTKSQDPLISTPHTHALLLLPTHCIVRYNIGVSKISTGKIYLWKSQGEPSLLKSPCIHTHMDTHIDKRTNDTRVRILEYIYTQPERKATLTTISRHFGFKVSRVLQQLYRLIEEGKVRKVSLGLYGTTNQ